MLNIGDKAPDFALHDQTGSIVTLDQLVAEGDLILYFYPADFTPICTSEACAFRDIYNDLTETNIKIAGVSPQAVDSHSRFANEYDIPFPLLYDEDKEVIRTYGVDGPFGFGVRRATFLIDPTKYIRNRVVSDFSIRSHVALLKSSL